MDSLNNKWTGRLLKLAKDISEWSKDESTKVGTVITTYDGRPISWGFNGMPQGINDDVVERRERPLKYKWMAHAERNAMDLASVSDLSECVMYSTFSPCSQCAQSIIQKKIKTVVVDENFSPDKVPERWQEDMIIADQMLREAGVTVIHAKSD